MAIPQKFVDGYSRDDHTNVYVTHNVLLQGISVLLGIKSSYLQADNVCIQRAENTLETHIHHSPLATNLSIETVEQT